MSTDKKYYVPDISEFHVGFEHEYQFPDGTWKQQTIDNLIEEIDGTGCRVKYLDREDIESLGFEFYESKGNSHFTYNVFMPEFRGRSNKWLHVMHVPHSNWCIIYISDTQEGVDESICFTGTIKNKSELKRVLKQIGYEQTQ